MNVDRYYKSIQKMYPGTMGGQSRVATPLSPLFLLNGTVVESPPCTGWVFVKDVSEISLTSWGSAFDPFSDDYVWIADTQSVRKYDFTTLTGLSGSANEVDFSATLPTFFQTGVAATVHPDVDDNDTTWLYIIGWEDDFFGERWAVWAQRYVSGTWVGSRIWNSSEPGAVSDPSSGHVPAIQYAPENDRIYFIVPDPSEAFDPNPYQLLSLPAGDPSIDQTATVHWTGDGTFGAGGLNLLRSRTGEMMWMSDTASGSVVYSTVPGSGVVNQQILPDVNDIRWSLVHDPLDSTSVYAVNWASPTVGYRVANNGSSSSSLSTPDILNDSVLATNATTNQAGSRGLFQQSQWSGGWYRWECA